MALQRARLLALLSTLIVGCDFTFEKPAIDKISYDANQPGITCASGFQRDGALGCTREVVPGEVAIKLVLRNDLSTSFVLNAAALAIDGKVLYVWKKDGESERGAETPILAFSLPPGEHDISVRFLLRGHGTGVFSYLSGYRFTVKSSHQVQAEPGYPLGMTVVVGEKGGVTTPLEERPAVQWVERNR